MWSKTYTVFPGAHYDVSTYLETVLGFEENNLFIQDCMLLKAESLFAF